MSASAFGPLRWGYLCGMSLLLAACSGGQSAQPAQFIAPQPAVAELRDGLRAHYNLLPTLSLNPSVARQYQIERNAGTALLVVALRESDGTSGAERSAQGHQIQARAQNLAGQRQTIALREVSTGEYTDHIGVIAVGAHDQIRIQVTVKTQSQSSEFQFQRSF